MKFVNGIAVHDKEEHLIWHLENNPLVDGKGTYQWAKIQYAYNLMSKFGVAYDVGAQIGLWTRVLAIKFKQVIAFEPNAECYPYYHSNVFAENAKLYPVALGEHTDTGTMERHPGSHQTLTRMLPDGSDGIKVDVIRLDEIVLSAFLPSPDFIKVDCDGFDLFVLRGGEKTIKQHLPVIVVEQKADQAQRYGLGETDAVKYLESLGYKNHFCIGGDYFMLPPGHKIPEQTK